jgi:hypothetical protein
MRYVLDRLTEQFKGEKAAQYVAYVLHQILASLSFDGRTALVEGLFARMRDALPPHTDVAHPERYADAEAIASIVHAWSKATERFGMTVRSM